MKSKTNSKKLFNKNFSMVLIGQIISLFGNAILRFALPLYLLNQTNSSFLFGLVSALGFIPLVILSPVGGIIADRVNKRNIMVILDFTTALLTFIVFILLGNINLVVLLIITMMILYGIEGIYQPSVQASVPVLEDKENLVPANSAITLVNSVAGLIGPALGGIILSGIGINYILIVSIICFVISAVMEIFIHIPYTKRNDNLSIGKIVKSDMKDSIKYIAHDNAIILKLSLVVTAMNLFFSTLIIIGIPVLINQKLGFAVHTANRLYGYCQSFLAIGGLIGGLLAGIIGKRIKTRNTYWIMFGCGLTLLPIALVLMLSSCAMMSYIVIVISCTVMMILSTLFSILVIAYVQTVTPTEIIGKVMSLLACLVMCAQPIGQAMYGGIFQIIDGKSYLIFLFATIISVIIIVLSRKSFKQIED